MRPRKALAGTHAELLLEVGFFDRYLQLWLSDGAEEVYAGGRTVFQNEAIEILRVHCSEEALSTPLTLTGRLSNRVLAVCIRASGGKRMIYVNTRILADPDQLTHFLVEEYVHAQQILDGVDFAAQRQRFAYAERPYKLEAKRIATALVGYDPENYLPILRRDEPPGLLYDRPETYRLTPPA